MNGDVKYVNEAVELFSKASLDPNVGMYAIFFFLLIIGSITTL